MSNVSSTQLDDGVLKSSNTQQSGTNSYKPPHLRKQVSPVQAPPEVVSNQPIRTYGQSTQSNNRFHDSRGNDSRANSSNVGGSRRWADNSSPSDYRSSSNNYSSNERFSRSNFHSNDNHSTTNRFGSRNNLTGAGVGLHARDARLEAELFGELKQQTGINFNKYEDIPVEVSGNNIPKSFNVYGELELHEILADNVKLCGYEHPTPVQKNAIPIALDKRDVMACAQTGSGKTCAFLLPFVQLVLSGQLGQNGNQHQSRRAALPLALVLSPTRELTIQIFNEARKLLYRTGIRPVVVYGGADIKDQLRAVERGVDLIVATPGRLVDMVDRGRVSLSSIEYLVFDEADRMLDMGFEPQIRQLVLQSDMPTDARQTLMFSATFPKEIQQLASDFLNDYIFLAVGRVGSTTDFITQKVQYAGERETDKIDALMNILSTCEGLTLIFVETKRAADQLEHILMREGIEATSIHGDRTQQEREQALAWFRCGRCPVLAATDVASRGLDIPDVRVVINYDLPNNIDDYVHRIGRTGRAGNTGTAISFVSEKNKSILRDLYDLLKETNQECPDWFDTMARQSTSFGPSYNRGSNNRGGRGRGGHFGGRDFRNDDKRSFSNNNSNGYNAPPQRSAPASRGNNKNNHGSSNQSFIPPPPGRQHHGSSHNDAW